MIGAGTERKRCWTAQKFAMATGIIKRGRPPLENPKEAVKLSSRSRRPSRPIARRQRMANTYQCRLAKGSAKASRADHAADAMRAESGLRPCIRTGRGHDAGTGSVSVQAICGDGTAAPVDGAQLRRVLPRRRRGDPARKRPVHRTAARPITCPACRPVPICHLEKGQETEIGG